MKTIENTLPQSIKFVNTLTECSFLSLYWDTIETALRLVTKSSKRLSLLDIYLINDKYQCPVSHRIMLQQDKEHQNSQGTRETICKLTNFWWHRIHEVSTNSIMRKIIMTGYYIKSQSEVMPMVTKSST